eukprot:scaffold160274_cov28-Tisochrysis_lutea.AAC.4
MYGHTARQQRQERVQAGVVCCSTTYRGAPSWTWVDCHGHQHRTPADCNRSSTHRRSCEPTP